MRKFCRENSPRCGARGISLIEVCFFITVSGLILAGAAPIYTLYENHRHLDITRANLASVQSALDAYYLQNGRFPCPARRDLALDNSGYGQEDGAIVGVACTSAAAFPLGTTFPDAGTARAVVANATGHPVPVRIGALPVRALGLPDNADSDGWGHRLTYAVTEIYGTPAAANNMNAGAITIQDSHANSATAGPANVVYAVVAPGADTRGAYNSNGKAPVCGTRLNCKDTGTFISTTLNSNTAASVFTDIAVYRGGAATICTAPNSIFGSPCYNPGKAHIYFYDLSGYGSKTGWNKTNMNFITAADRIKTLELFTNNVNIPDQLFSQGFPGASSLTKWFGACYDGSFNVALGDVGDFVFSSNADDGVALYIDGNPTYVNGVMQPDTGNLVMINEEMSHQSEVASLPHDYGQLTTGVSNHTDNLMGDGQRLGGQWDSFYAISTPVHLSSGQHKVMIQYVQAWPHELAAQVFSFTPSQVAAGNVPVLSHTKATTEAVLGIDATQPKNPNLMPLVGPPGGVYECPH